jgi:hypothetical protein
LNDTIQTAFEVPSTLPSFAGLTICPEGDKDTFRIVTTVAMSNIEAITTVTSGPAAAVSILNAGGTSINNGTSNGPNSLRALAANVPVGTYYVQVYAASTVTQTYRLDLDVSQ